VVDIECVDVTFGVTGKTGGRVITVVLHNCVLL
jgi:hypothetical protein